LKWWKTVEASQAVVSYEIAPAVNITSNVSSGWHLYLDWWFIQWHWLFVNRFQRLQRVPPLPLRSNDWIIYS
jgi:hypothetical protein